jgi:glutamate N-acetyltransferase/amino-acid N-acetyltransferase
MAIGKTPNVAIDQARTTVCFGDLAVYPLEGSAPLTELERYLSNEVVDINIDLGGGSGTWTVYGCDLTDGYIRINADYTT